MIFIDSGSTCYYVIDFIKAENITVVTNGIAHIQKLMAKGINTYILGGYAKPDQNLIIGEDTEKKVSNMNFDVAFLGTMGIDKEAGNAILLKLNQIIWALKTLSAVVEDMTVLFATWAEKILLQSVLQWVWKD